MNTWQIQLPLGSLPIALIACFDSSVVLTPTQQFKTIVDASNGFESMFDMDGFSINGEQFEYGVKYYYKEMPNLLGWLQKQGMEMPKFN